MAVDVNANPFGDDRPKFYTALRAVHAGYEFTRQADGRWLDDYGRELTEETDGKLTVIEPKIEPWDTHSLARWEDKEIGEDGWFLDEWVPIGQVVSLYGRPGSRKSTLLLQWMIAGSIGEKFGNSLYPLAYGPTYGLFCEDGERQIARRARAMLKHYGKRFRDMSDCHAESLVNAHMTEFVSFRRSGLMDTTPAWAKFCRDLDRLKPIFVVLDVAADFFGGDEIRRRESSQFLRLLDRTADERHLAMVFSAHPSVRGMRDRSLTSGSTGWEGKVRARMTLEDPSDHDRDKDDDDPVFNQSDQRTLTLAKANYARHGTTMNLTVKDGVFIPTDLDPDNKSSGPANQAAAERTFLDRLTTALDAGTTLTNYRDNHAYAPTALSTKDFPFKTAEAAMKRLFDKKTLRYDRTKKAVKDRWIITPEGTRP